MGRLDYLYRSEISNRAVSTYLYLKDRANKNGACWPSITTIAKELKVSESMIRRAVKELKRERLLKTEQGYRPNGGKSSLLYILTER